MNFFCHTALYKRKKKTDVQQSKRYFSKLLEKNKLNIDSTEFNLERMRYLEKNPHLIDIPTLQEIENIYENYNKK